METGDIIKKLRNEKKITQSELGLMLGVNTSSIQKYESGATKNLKLETIRELCYIFDIPPVVFVFPEIKEMSFEEYLKEFNSIDFMFDEMLNLNNEEKRKILEYINDIRSMEKYRKKSR